MLYFPFKYTLDVHQSSIFAPIYSYGSISQKAPRVLVIKIGANIQLWWTTRVYLNEKYNEQQDWTINNSRGANQALFRKIKQFLWMLLLHMRICFGTFRSRLVLPIASTMTIFVPSISIWSFEFGCLTPANFPSLSLRIVDCRSPACIDLHFRIKKEENQNSRNNKRTLKT